jgi:hypothetical protein
MFFIFELLSFEIMKVKIYNYILLPLFKQLKLVLLVLSLLLMGSIKQASASHVVGSDITYKCTSTPGIFEVTFVFYRACDGIPICSGGCGSPCSLPMSLQGADPSCSSSTFGSVSLALVSVRDVGYDSDCPTSKNICTNMGCVAAGTYTPAVERYEFKGFANIGSTSGIPASCCNVRFSVSISARNGSISTGAANQNFYMDAIVNRCLSVSPCNSSPTLTNDPFAIICGGDNYVFNNGAVDPDLDSLSYSFTPALQGFGSSVPYTPPFAYDKPMPWTGSATGVFPAGIHCDPLNGDIMFTPPNAGGIFAGVMAIEIKQWKLINGVMTVVGITRRDIQMVVRGDCLPNNPPRLITDPPEDNNVNIPRTNWSICAGDQLCFTITAKDTDFNPPTVSDTTYLSWNAALASYGATFLPDYNPAKRRLPDSLGGGPREDRYRFCWTPDESKASTTPYYFTVSAKDKRCPNPGRVTRAFSVLVIGKANLAINKANLKCGKWGFSYTNLNPKFTPTSTFWQISRVPGDESMSQNPYTYANTANPGSIQFAQGGRYYIQIKAVTPGPIGTPGCEKIIRDSFDVDSVMIVQKRDTLTCLGNSVQLTVSPKHGTPLFTYRWFNNIKDTATAPLNPNVSTANFSVTPSATRYYTVQIRDLNGCKAYDSLKVDVKQLPVGLLPSTMRICNEDTFTLDPGNNGGNIKSYLWNVGDTTQTIAKRDSGLYIVVLKDTFNCQQSDSTMLYVNLKVLADAGPDKAICEGESVTLKGTGGQKYQWRNLNNAPFITASTDTFKVTPTSTTIPTRYELKAILGYPDSTFKVCTNTDTVIVTVNARPKLKKPSSAQECFTSPTAYLPSFFLDPFQTPSQGAGTGVWSYPKDPSAIIGGSSPQVQINKLKNIPSKDTLGSFDNKIVYTFTGPANLGGCVTIDSANVRIYGTPPTNAGPDVTRCDIGGIYELSKVHPFSPQNPPLRTGEVWIGPGVGSYTTGGVTYYTFNPKSPLAQRLPAKNLLEYQYTHTYNTTSSNPDYPVISCYKADQMEIGVTTAPTIAVSKDILVCQNEPVFTINSKTDGTIIPTVGTSPYWEASDAALKGTGIINGQSFNATGAGNALPILNGQMSRSFKVYYRDTSTGCVVQDSINIGIARVPRVDLTYADKVADSPYVCLNTKSVLFKMTSTQPNSSTVTWEPSNGMEYSVLPVSGMSAFGPDPSNPSRHLFNSTQAGAGTYWLKLKHTNNQGAGPGFAGCSAVDSTLIIVQDPPKITVASPGVICSYDQLAPVSLSQAPTGYGFTWEVSGDGQYTDLTANPGEYTPGAGDKALGQVYIKAVTLKKAPSTVDNGDQCSPARDSSLLTIAPAPNATIIPIDSEGCVPYVGQFAAGPTGVSNADFTWSWDGVEDSVKDSIITYQVDNYQSSVGGKYGLGLVVKSVYGSKECVSVSSPAMLVTHAVPVASFIAEPPYTTIAKPFFNFINQSTVADGSTLNYLWNLGPGPDPLKTDNRYVTVVNPTNIEYAADTAWQRVWLTATSQYGCVDSTSIRIRIEPDITVFIPNAFRPNSKDGTVNTTADCVGGLENCNQYFKVVANGQLSVEVFIYNRWGQLVFHSTQPDAAWNGQVENTGEYCPQDVYVYQVNATSFSGKAYKYSGSVTLLR